MSRTCEALIVANGGLLASDLRRLLQWRRCGGNDEAPLPDRPSHDIVPHRPCTDDTSPEYNAQRCDERGGSLLIAADGALERLLKHGIRPDAVVGDFDSLSAEAQALMSPETLVPVPDQDRCDLDKALEYAISHGCRSITILGGLGRRWDHSFTTLSLLIRYAQEARIQLRDGATSIAAVTDGLTVRGTIGDRLSLIAFATARGVTLTGVDWPLAEVTMEPGSLGVSNRMAAPTAELRLESGCLILCHTARKDGILSWGAVSPFHGPAPGWQKR